MEVDLRIMKTDKAGFAPVKISIILESYKEVKEFKDFNDEILNISETPMEEEIVQMLDCHLDAMLKCNIPTL